MQVSILCGGKSSRMHSEKGLVLYKSKPFIEHVIDAVLPISNNIQLVTNSNNYDYLAYPKIKDIIVDKGPLGGIYSALYYSESEMNLILSCDIPLISSEIVKELIDKHKAYFDVTVFEDNFRIHPLIGIYSKKIIPILQKAIHENELKLMHFITNVNHQCIPIANEKRNHLKNVNSLAELYELNAY